MLLAFTFAAAALAAGAVPGLPSCAPPVEIHDLAILRVERNGVLVSTDGRAIALEGIQLPAGAQDHAPQSFADQAIAALGDLAAGHLVTVTAQAPKQDRYGRVRGQLFVTDDTPLWLQQALLRRGLARVAVEPSRRECVRELYAAEGEARAKKLGIWSLPAYSVRSSDHLGKNDVGTFQIVQGKVANASVKSRAYLNFGGDWRADFTATIAREDMKLFRAANIDPASYAGKTIRVRGVVEWFHGPEIQIESPADIEVVSDSSR